MLHCFVCAVEPVSVDAGVLLQKLQDAMAGITAVRADFRQEKNLSLFAKSVVITGSLEIEFPDRFTWEVKQPIRTRIVSDGSSISVWDGETGITTRTNVRDNPMVKIVWNQIDSWFMGRYSELSEHYDVIVQSESPPVVRFVPKNEKIKLAVGSITVFFRDDLRYLSRVVLAETGGDSTTMDFTNVVIEDKIDPK